MTITMTLTVHEWRILAVAVIIEVLSKRSAFSDSDRKLARDLANRIAEQTGKFGPTPQ